MSSCAANFSSIRQAIDDCAKDVSRDPAEVRLLAVSKNADISAIRELYDHGVRDFGENRAAVLQEKAANLPDDINWHFIGTLQSNKIRRILQSANVIHSVDSLDLIKKLDRIAGEEGKTPEFYLEISVSGETSKGGFSLEEADLAVAVAGECRYAKLAGLMTMAPLAASHEYLVEIFSGLRAIAKKHSISGLSMGMSGDFKEAISCGSTIVRVGTAIFGK